MKELFPAVLPIDGEAILGNYMSTLKKESFKKGKA